MLLLKLNGQSISLSFLLHQFYYRPSHKYRLLGVPSKYNNHSQNIFQARLYQFGIQYSALFQTTVSLLSTQSYTLYTFPQYPLTPPTLQQYFLIEINQQKPLYMQENLFFFLLNRLFQQTPTVPTI